MLIENNMEKNIVMPTKGKPHMKREGLIINKSYDDFELGSNIVKYKDKPHYINKYDDDPFPWDCYNFIHNGYEIEVWCENDIITSICCNYSCIYKGQELINMNYKDFLQLIDEVPIAHDIIYVLVSKNHGQNQHVYVFDKSGLQIWVWRNKIRTVIIYNSNDTE